MWKNYEKTYKKCTKPAYIQPESLEGNFKKKIGESQEGPA